MTQELKVTSASAYRTETTFLRELKSGRVFRLKEPDGKVLAKLLKIFGLEIPEVREDETIEEVRERLRNNPQVPSLSMDKLEDLIILLLPACVVEPKIVWDWSETDDKHLHFEEMVQSDQLDILFVILEVIGLSIKAMEEDEDFPKAI
jgi:hypothetical protein